MPTTVSRELLHSIRALLTQAGVDFEELEHETVRTAAEAATARGSALAEGAKSLLFKAGDRFGIYVMSADRSMHSLQVRRHLGVRRTRFADPEELERLVGAPPGAVPPFGRPVVDLPLYADPSVLVPERIAFTAGVREISMRLRGDDWRRVASPEIFSFSR